MATPKNRSGGIAVAFGICLSTLCVTHLRAQTSAADTGSAPAQLRKVLEPASIHAGPGLQCKLYPVGSAPSAAVTVSTDDDGYARFHAVKAAAGEIGKRLIMDCTDAAGKLSSYSANLASDETFAPHPIDIASERGIDRPALTGDPMQSTQLQLVQQGYGLRPDPEKDPAAYSRWLASASAPGKQLFTRRPNLHVHTVFTTSSPWWVGSVLTGAPGYVSVEATFNVPRAIPGGDATTSTGVAIWNGLGGYGTGSGLIQGGIQIQTGPSTAVPNLPRVLLRRPRQQRIWRRFQPQSGRPDLFPAMVLRFRRQSESHRRLWLLVPAQHDLGSDPELHRGQRLALLVGPGASALLGQSHGAQLHDGGARGRVHRGRYKSPGVVVLYRLHRLHPHIEYVRVGFLDADRALFANRQQRSHGL
jgi:hypothetical protein